MIIRLPKTNCISKNCFSIKKSFLNIEILNIDKIRNELDQDL